MMHEKLKRKLEGLYFFAISEGSYSDYGVNGMYICDHEITEKEWHEFCNIERTKRNVIHDSIVKASWNEERETYYKQWEEWYEISKGMQSMEEMFVELHNMIPVPYEEFNLDY